MGALVGCPPPQRAHVQLARGEELTWYEGVWLQTHMRASQGNYNLTEVRRNTVPKHDRRSCTSVQCGETECPSRTVLILATNQTVVDVIYVLLHDWNWWLNIWQITGELSSSSFPATESHSPSVQEGTFMAVSCGTHWKHTNGTWSKVTLATTPLAGLGRWLQCNVLIVVS